MARTPSYAELLDPKWKGKILADDLRVAGAGQAFFQGSWFAFGREYHEKLARNELVLHRRNFEEADSVIRSGGRLTPLGIQAIEAARAHLAVPA